MPNYWVIGTIGTAATAIAASIMGAGPAARLIGAIARELGRAAT